MIAIPLTSKASWRNPPWITVALILINLIVFVVFQHNDDRHWSEAHAFYYESDLARLEAELYDIYLEKQGRGLDAEEAAKMHAPENERLANYRHRINHSPDFLVQIEQGRLIAFHDPRYEKWRQLRGAYNEKMERVTAVTYGFRPAYPRPATWLTSMFLHGGWEHLVGNMIFLWLIGCLIEYGCRHVLFPVVYLLGGLMSVGFFWLLNMHSTIPLVGASGAISGIMGAMTVFYGTKKINVFLNLGFYFNYFKFRAILLLPLWMGHELYQMILNTGSPVAYAAHLGGLAGGALLAWIVGQLPGCLDRDAFESPQENKTGALMERALAHMSALEFSAARPLLEQALTSRGDDASIWRHLYIIDRQDPQSTKFHQTSRNLLHLYCQQPATYPQACAFFREYLHFAKPPRLPADLYLRVSSAFCETGEPTDAERIILSLIKKSPHLTGLPLALLKLGRSFERQNQPDKLRHCIQLLKTHYPSANETRLALQLHATAVSSSMGE